MALAVTCNDFKAIVNHAVHTDEGKKIVRNHLTAMKKELATLKKEMKKRAKRSSAANPSSSISTTSAQLC
jgi:ribosome-interacting GTPase 1